MKHFLEEFKAFAMRGNVVDMAVGVVVGGAFSKIVTSLVNDIITPFISVVSGGINVSSLSLILNEDTGLALTYGNFIQSIIDFIIIAFSIFVAIKVITKMRKKKEEEEEVKLVVNPEVELLSEIRDLLKEGK